MWGNQNTLFSLSACQVSCFPERRQNGIHRRKRERMKKKKEKEEQGVQEEERKNHKNGRGILRRERPAVR